MKKIEITSPQVQGRVTIGIREITGWWASKKSTDRKYQITNARLEQTVYFVIQTRGVANGTKLFLRLYNLEELFFLDYLQPDKYKFNGKEETAITYVDNGTAFVELQLPLTWTQDIKNDYGKIELYWRVNCSSLNETYLPEKEKDYLAVRYSDKTLYIKPSIINNNFPEFYDSDGSLLVVGMASDVSWEKKGVSQDNMNEGSSGLGASEISDIVDKEVLEPVVEKKIQRLTLIKLSSGYMVDNKGQIYTNITDRGTARKVYFKKIYTTDGKLVDSFQGKSFSLPDGTATVGIDQYRFFSKHGMKAKTLGVLKKVGGIWDVFSFVDILNLGLEDEKGSLPIPVPGADVLGMIAQVKFQEFDEIWEQYRNEDLEKTKRMGVSAVEKWVNSPIAKGKYEILEISHKTAGYALLGRFKTINELMIYEDNLSDSEKDVVILLRIELAPITSNEIYVIETFFRR